MVPASVTPIHLLLRRSVQLSIILIIKDYAEHTDLSN